MPRLTPIQLRGGLAGVAILAVVGLMLVAKPFGAVPAPSPSAGGRSPSPLAIASSTTAPSAEPSATPGTSAAPGLVAADLDGLYTTPDRAHRLPLAVSIDDATAARPQFGFDAASVVWQAPVDGYESRYLLVFQERDASKLGPVRSARFFFAQWCAEIGGALAHYGGDRLTLRWLAAAGVPELTNLDGLGPAYTAYHRTADHEVPHNVYTSTAALLAMAARLGGPESILPRVADRPFRDDSPPASLPSGEVIAIPYHTVRVGYAFDRGTDAYVRSLNGVAQVDPLDGQQVTARTVVVLYMPFHTDPTIEPGHDRPVLGFVGTGAATVFTEGRSIAATWSKPDAAAPTRILGPDGQELAFVRGRIFMQVVPLGTKVAS